MNLNDELKFFFGTCTPVPCGFLLVSMLSDENLLAQASFLGWLVVGAGVLFMRCNFPWVVVAKLPREPVMKGLFIFGSWLLWPVWVVRLPKQP